jgi:LPXTG-motif cell wall-anchored protein
VLGPDNFSRRFTGVRDCSAKTKLLGTKTDAGGGDDGGLPVTGAAVGGALAAGIALLGTGALVLFLVRRRRTA